MPNTRKILIVEDDSELRDALTEQLSLHEEFEAVAVDTGSKGVQAAKAGQIDLVIMDVGLPDIDGREAVRIMRKNGFKAPIIMLTAHDTDSDTILGLESGANDYVAKPFRFAVLLARIRAQLRQHEASEDAVFTIGPYTFRPSSKLLLNAKGNKVRLTEKETSILRYLYRAGQRPVSRETLLQEVWGYNSGVTTHTLETHIYRLRQKIEKDAAVPAILVTEAGGYKLVPLSPLVHEHRRRNRFVGTGADLATARRRCVAQLGDRCRIAVAANRTSAVQRRRYRRRRFRGAAGFFVAAAGRRKRRRYLRRARHIARRDRIARADQTAGDRDCARTRARAAHIARDVFEDSRQLPGSGAAAARAACLANRPLGARDGEYPRRSDAKPAAAIGYSANIRLRHCVPRIG